MTHGTHTCVATIEKGFAGAPKKRKVLILAPFLGTNGRWIDDFCDSASLEFNKAAYIKRPGRWHNRGATTPILDWFRHFQYAQQAMQSKPDCIVTAFPQLPLVVSILLRLKGWNSTRLVAWNFNLGSLSSGWKGYLAGKILRRVDRFIVHARSEVGNYARWLSLEEAKFQFLPLQRGGISPAKPTPLKTPYIVSMGSANRDYTTLVDAVVGTGIKTVIISKKSIIDALPDHADLIRLHGLTEEECNTILAGAELNVVPIAAQQTASGQVTFTTSMRMGVPTVATRCAGTVDYISDGVTGFLVSPNDPSAMRRTIEALWQDKDLRLGVGSAAREYADKHFSDEEAGRHLMQVIFEVLGETQPAQQV